jgi:hypothetical protein
VDLFELTGLGGDRPTPAQGRYVEALARYRAARFAEAAVLLGESEDGPSRWLAVRCRDLAAERPGDWRPVTHLDAK